MTHVRTCEEAMSLDMLEFAPFQRIIKLQVTDTLRNTDEQRRPLYRDPQI